VGPAAAPRGRAARPLRTRPDPRGLPDRARLGRRAAGPVPRAAPGLLVPHARRAVRALLPPRLRRAARLGADPAGPSPRPRQPGRLRGVARRAAGARRARRRRLAGRRGPRAVPPRPRERRDADAADGRSPRAPALHLRGPAGRREGHRPAAAAGRPRRRPPPGAGRRRPRDDGSAAGVHGHAGDVSGPAGRPGAGRRLRLLGRVRLPVHHGHARPGAAGGDGLRPAGRGGPVAQLPEPAGPRPGRRPVRAGRLRGPGRDRPALAGRPPRPPPSGRGGAAHRVHVGAGDVGAADRAIALAGRRAAA